MALLLARTIGVQAQFIFTTNNGAITITAYTGSGGDVIIPRVTNGYPVTAIGDSAFYRRLTLTSVTIPDSITTIGDLAFYACTHLASVTIPNSVTNVGSLSFAGSGLTNIAVDANNPSYASTGGVLFNKTLTTLIQYPASLIGSYAIPNSVTTIGDYAFSHSLWLTSVTVPNSVTDIGGHAFEYCLDLASITIPSSVTNVGYGAFAFSRLTNIAVDADNPTYASAGGVLFNKSLTTLIQYPPVSGGSYAIPNSVTNIVHGAFYDSGLTSVTIPNSLTLIENDAFDFCDFLESIAVDTDNPSYASAGGVLFDKTLTTLVLCPKGLPGSYAIPDGVNNIGANAFHNCASLTKVTIPNSVTNIGSLSFLFCSGLTDVTIPDSVTTIGSGAFQQSGLKNVTIGNSVSEIAESAFAACFSLTKITIPNSVTTIGNYAFAVCSNLTSLTIPSSVTNIGVLLFDHSGLTNISVAVDNPSYASAGGVLFNKTLTTLIQYPPRLSGSYAIPNGVTNLGYRAFAGCFGLTKVTIPESVNTISAAAFASCFALTNAYFQGNAPSVDGGPGSADSSVFSGEIGFVSYLAGASGWGSAFGGWPTIQMAAPQAGGNIGIHSGIFAFDINGAANQTFIVEVSANLVDWQLVSTSALNGAHATFTDSQWTNYTKRFYRAR